MTGASARPGAGAATGAGAAAGIAAGGELETPFAAVLSDAIRGTQALEARAARLTEGLMRGDGVDVHQVMIATEQADTAFEMALAVRGKAISAYQSLMGTQF
jgi:flagellar hook-basal body complex protein FliE